MNKKKKPCFHVWFLRSYHLSNGLKRHRSWSQRTDMAQYFTRKDNNLSSWPEKAHSDPMACTLLPLGHINCCVCMGPICHSNHTCPQQQQHPESVGKKGCDSGAGRLWEENHSRGFCFMEGGGEGEPFLKGVFLGSSCLQISKDLYIFPAFWPLIAPFVPFYHYILGSLCWRDHFLYM